MTPNPLAALEKAARQLGRSPNRPNVFVCSTDPIIVSCEPTTFLNGLIGRTVQEYGVVALREAGSFASENWRHVGAVALLDYIPGADRKTYACTILTNPWCKGTVAVERAWFPRGRVLAKEGERFRWRPEEPDRAFVVPTGTFIPEELR